MAVEQLTNAASSTTTGAVDGSSNPVTFSVASAAAFPAAGNFRIIIDSEILLVTAVAGSSFTASRAQEGTAIASHLSGATVTHVLTAGAVRTLYQNYISTGILASMPAAGLAGRVYYPTDLQGSFYVDNGSAWTKISPGNAAMYPPFVPAGVDDEFDDNNFSGWTLVDDGTHTVTVTESNDAVTLSLPGGDTSAHLHAWLKSMTVTTNTIIELAFSCNGVAANFQMAGLIFSDGTTFGSGNQAVFALVAGSTNTQMFAQTGFNSQGSDTVSTMTSVDRPLFFMQFQYLGGNNWCGLVSSDGVAWVNVTGTQSISCTPTFVGFFATSWGASGAFDWNIKYFRHH